MIKKICIIGGGTAGWLAAAWFSSKLKNVSITVVESSKIPKIGVGESVTPHVAGFFRELGIDDKHWMKHTGSIYKFANKFVNWKENKGEYEYFSFNYPVNVKLLRKEIQYATDTSQWIYDKKTVRTTDTFLHLLDQKVFDKFDRYFDSQFHYMEKNVMPFDDDEYLLNPYFSWSQHINADLAAEYVRDNIALGNGVNHIISDVKDVIFNENNVQHLILDDDRKLSFDFYIDATGFNKVLIKKLGWKFIPYKDNVIDSAWVCQTDYSDVENEMVNYTQSIAEPHGWRFKIGLYHRMGNGYCFSSSHTDKEKALEHFNQKINFKRAEPRLITWTPGRLEYMAKGNVAAIGLSCGFVEPLEANALYTIINTIKELTVHLQSESLDFHSYNDKVTKSIDDIADFLLVHYTLSDRTDTDFWKDLRNIGVTNDHKSMVFEKYNNRFNSMNAALTGYTMFPEYMWAQLAQSWNLNLSNWFPEKFSELDLLLTKLHFEHSERKNNAVSDTRMKNFHWLKNKIYDDLNPSQWSEKYLRKS
jgi:flavin-dependent dehydrogenase